MKTEVPVLKDRLLSGGPEEGGSGLARTATCGWLPKERGLNGLAATAQCFMETKRK